MEGITSPFKSYDLNDGSRVVTNRNDGLVSHTMPERITSSPLDVDGVDLEITTDEIVEFIAESRRFS